MTNFEVRASNDVANDEATTESGGRDRLILYNPQWMEGLESATSKWSDWVVLAHEVGHHVAFHMDPSFPNHDAELQADYFAKYFRYTTCREIERDVGTFGERNGIPCQNVCGNTPLAILARRRTMAQALAR